MEASGGSNVTCSECGAEYEDMLWFCPACGKLPPYPDSRQPDAGSPLKENRPAGRTKANKSAACGRPGGDDEPDHRRFSRSLVVRIIVTVAILALLLAAVWLISGLRSRRRQDGSVPRSDAFASQETGRTGTDRGAVRESSHVTKRTGEVEALLHGLRPPDAAAAEDLRGLWLHNAAGQGRRPADRSRTAFLLRALRRTGPLWQAVLC